MELAATAVENARQVKLVIFDVDGVLTDGGIYIGAAGELYKAFNAKDGLGVTLAQLAGLETAIITGRQSPQVACRAQELHINHVMQGQMDKRAAYQQLKAKLGLEDEQIAYLGDDLIDLPVMVQVGFTAAPADASPEVRRLAQAVSSHEGGHGAVREILEFILKVQGKWEPLIAQYYCATPQAEVQGLAQ